MNVFIMIIIFMLVSLDSESFFSIFINLCFLKAFFFVSLEKKEKNSQTVKSSAPRAHLKFFK